MIVLATLLVILIIYLYHYLTQCRGYLEKTGIPMIKPFFCFGSPPYLLHKVKMHEWYAEQFKRLGLTFCRYEGIAPVIHTIDPEIVKEVTVKQFDNFLDVFDFDFPPEQTTLDIMRGDAWRAMRKVLTPTFTSGKLKGMLSPILSITDNVINHLKKQSGQEVNLKPIIRGFTVDSICRVAFGLQTQTYLGLDQDLMKSAESTTTAFTTYTWTSAFWYNVMGHFPFLAAFTGFFDDESVKLRTMTNDIMRERDLKNVQVGDFVDRLREFKKSIKPPITEGMIDAQGMIFILGGFETTSTTIGSLMYYLATHPDVQDRVLEEISDLADIDEDNIKDLHFMEACIQETLRLSPVIGETFRVCTNDCIIKGIQFQKGVKISMPIYPSHINPEFFENPQSFRPDRFLKDKENLIIPYTWRPFGSGSRMCLGQRLALMEMKIFMAKFLQTFQLVPTAKTNLEVESGGLFMLSYPEIIVKLEQRT